jgi:hypothetical protein
LCQRPDIGTVAQRTEARALRNEGCRNDNHTLEEHTMNIIPTYRRLAAAALVPATLLTALAVTTQPAQAEPEQAPGKQRTGQEAVDALGQDLDKAAKSVHLSPAKLKETLRHDKTLKVDAHGDLLYADKAPEESGTATITDSVTAPIYATTDTFRLHSRPSSPMKIYLDFNGHTTSGTKWNTNFTRGAAFTTPAFDRNGSTTVSNLEHAIIQATWLSVREDYAPFNVDVTTQDPGYEGLRYSGAGDTAYGVRVVVGRNTWYPYSAGGVGYTDSFGDSDTPVYVFANGHGAKFVSEAASHEAGHAFGLAHDGTTAGVTYYGGQNNWAPIMGNSYSKAVTQWSRGEYAGANNTQDDLGLIARYTGWAADDYAGSTSTTGTLPAGTARYATVNWYGDVDAFRFSLSGTRTLRINTWHNTGPVDANLNMRLVLRNSAGTVVATSSPTGDLRTSMTRTLGAGTYYAYVDGVGEGSPYNTGYSYYASQGYYGIQLNWA